ncbi:MAG: T6SS effector amidase Tae4 family protein [Rubrivivax sp.]
MSIAHDFESAWSRYQEYRKVASGITEGNRCALVLAMSLGKRYYPDKSKGEHSFADLEDTFMVNAKGTVRNLVHGNLKVANRMADGIQGQPFLRKYYVKAEQFAKRLRTEWGDPDFILKGQGKQIVKRTLGAHGVIYIEDGWASGEDHIDLWNGTTTAAYDKDPAYAMEHIEASKEIWLWSFKSAIRSAGARLSKNRAA